MDVNYLDKRNSGISLINGIAWGSSFGQFYQTSEEFFEVLRPYFKAGLENNELCVWVTSRGGNEENIALNLDAALPLSDRHLRKNQLEIISTKNWTNRRTNFERFILTRLDQAISRSLVGVRLALDFSPGNRDEMLQISNKLTKAIGHFNVIALIAYPRENFDAIGLMEAVKNHQSALLKNSGRWEIIASSEARVARNASIRSEENLRALFNHMAEGFAYHRIVLDEKGQPCDYIFLEVNQAFEKLLGLKAKDIIGQKVTRVLPGIEKDTANWIGRYGTVALSGKSLNFNSYSETLNKWYSVSAFCPARGFFAVTVSDITENRKAEDDLKTTNERLKIISTASSLLLSSEEPEKIVQTIAREVMVHLNCDCFFNFIIDESAGRLRLNAYAGIPEEAARNIQWLDFGVAICGCAARDRCRIVSENIQENNDIRAELVRSFGVQAYACHPLTIGQRTIGTLSFGTRTRIHFTADELDLMRTIADQVSIAMERKRNEQNLKHYAAELESANKELEAFSYSVSHDLRAPLRALDGFSEAILEDYVDKLDETGKDYLNRVRSASQTMSQLIDDILKLSRVSRAEMHYDEVDLSDLSRSILEVLKADQPDRQTEFIIAPNLLVKGDLALLRVALNNLLENAWKYTGKCSLTRIEFGMTYRNDEKIYYIRDNGIGFNMQYSNKLFQPFQRLHTDKEYSGTGIGLATAQRVIHRHNGRIWAESELGQGATFYFTLD